MQAFVREQTKSTPWIKFDPAQNILEIKGESYPENSAKFYSPMLEWLEAYLQEVDEGPVYVDIELVYFNSSSSKILMNFFDLLEDAAQGGLQVNIEWKYHQDNEIALECGEEFEEDLEHVAFHLVQVNEVT
jgi:hypothetical protein